MSSPNTVGATIFVCYVISALVISGWICLSIFRAFSKSPLSRERSNKLEIATAASAVSFALLSYWMLAFLSKNYQLWKEPFPAARSGLGFDLPVYDLWEWLQDSTLFLKFAQTICGDDANFVWTSLALMYSLFWSMYMALEGTKSEVSMLSYFALTQILPTSFTQNLFVCSLLTARNKVSGQETRSQTRKTTRAPFALTLLVTVYTIGLLMAKSADDATNFMIVVGAVRLMLFAPYLIVRFAGVQSSAYLRTYAFPLIVIFSVGIVIRQVMSVAEEYGGDFSQAAKIVLGAIHSDPSVSALGYDFLIGVASLAVFRQNGILKEGERH